MTHEEWATRIKAAARQAAGSPEGAAADLLALADEVDQLLPHSFSEWHLSQTLSIAATILEDSDPEKALDVATRQVVALRHRLTGISEHLASAASHRALLLFALGKDRDANDNVAEAIRAAAFAPKSNLPLELALAKFIEHETKVE